MNTHSSHFLRRSLAVAMIATAPLLARADGLQSLEGFAKTVQSARATFTQAVTSPTREGQAPRVKNTSGSFEFQRPGRFRFVYNKPFEQTIVADGQTLWLYDVDLNQVSSRPQAEALGSTPAALVASAPDLKALQGSFSLKSEPARDGQQWVLATPKDAGGQIKSVRVGLREGTRGPELATLDILDSFGQRSVISFTGFEANPALPASTFQFKPPAGADVLKP